MKTTAILVALALVAMVTPASADPKEACDNEAFWQDMLTNPDYRQAAPDAVEVRPSLPVKVAHEEVDIDAIVADVTAHTGVCMADLLASEETGAFPQASDWFELYELAYDFTGQHCNGGENVGVGGHYDTGVDATTGAMPWSWGTTEYLGTAASDISASSTAYLKFGAFYDVSTGKGFSYAESIAYSGVSDFYCVGYFDAFFGDYVTINLPWVTGAVVSAA